MSHITPETSTDAYPLASQASLEDELSRVGMPRANQVVERLGRDMERELPELDTRPTYPRSTAPRPAHTLRSKADENIGTGPVSDQRPQPMLDARAVDVLNQSLADCMHLQIQCVQARWNMIASERLQIADLFEDINRAIGGHVTDVAKRIVALGGTPKGTLVAISERSGLNEYPAVSEHWQFDANSVASALTIIDAGLEDDIALLSKIGDKNSVDLLEDIRRSAITYLGYLPAAPTN